MEIHSQFEAFEQPEKAPNNNMVLSIVGTVLGLCSPCCIGLILGIIAIVLSSQVNNKFNLGDYNGAEKSAKNAKILAYVAIGLGVLGILSNIYLIMTAGGIDGYVEMLEEYQNIYGN